MSKTTRPAPIASTAAGKINNHLLMDVNHWDELSKNMQCAGYEELLEDFLHDISNKESHVFADIMYNDFGDPYYYIHIRQFNRLYTCDTIEEVASLIAEFRAFLQDEQKKRTAGNSLPFTLNANDVSQHVQPAAPDNDATATPNQSAPAVKRIDQYITMSHNVHIKFGDIDEFTHAGYEQIVAGFNPDPNDEESFGSFCLYNNDIDIDGCEDNPNYYVYITHYHRLYSCMTFFDVVALLNDYKALIQEEINKRKA